VHFRVSHTLRGLLPLSITRTFPMRKIKLTQGYVALVDNEDYQRVSQFKWIAKEGNTTVYAQRRYKNAHGKWTSQLLHRFVLRVKNLNVQIDHHPDSSGLNCQKNNLRLATSGENTHNQRLRKDSTSGYKGVSWHKQTHKWRANLWIDRVHKSLGLFKSPKEAAKAYDAAALLYHGEFAKTNANLGLI
jgi:hypothetical protein